MLKVLIRRKIKFVTVCWSVDGDHFSIFTYTKSLYCTCEINIMLYVNYISTRKGKKLAVKEVITKYTANIKKGYYDKFCT